MFRPRFFSLLPVVSAVVASGAGVAAGCSAEGKQFAFDDLTGLGSSSAGGAGGTGGASGAGGAGAAAPVDDFGEDVDMDAGPSEPLPEVAVNPCGSGCGPVELCGVDEFGVDHDGLDDNCDGRIDEICSCIPGQAHSCFRGDPSFRRSAGCFPGTQICNELGTWNDCRGGVHATEGCHTNDSVGCHAMQAAPFATVDLKAGTGSFGDDAVAGSEAWTVACPPGVDPCPGVNGTEPADDFQPLQSGEYTVTYTKRVEDGRTESCVYPLFVGARGLRVELEWEHKPTSVDLDLYLHEPNSTTRWKIGGSDGVCGYGNCQFSNLTSPSAIAWFNDWATPPEPVNWYLDDVLENNTCYFAPRGVGAKWRAHGKGCYNPRLDLDNITCKHQTTDPNDPSFCAPENINVDFPPKGGWMRIGVHYFRGEVAFKVHPRVKIYCNGELGADLGPAGSYYADKAVTFAPADAGERFWLVADVVFPEPGECGSDTCIVRPIYENEEQKTPYLTTSDVVKRNFGPPYPRPSEP